MPGEPELPSGFEYMTVVEFVPGEGQEFEYVPITPPVVEEPLDLTEEDIAKRVKKYIKLIRTTINVKKYGIASVIGKLTYSSVFSPVFADKNVSINSPFGWKSLINQSN